MAIYSSLSSGLRIWNRINIEVPEENVNILFDKLRVDLRNSFEYNGMIFSGGIEGVEFPTIVGSRQLGAKTVGRISYKYDSFARALKRVQRDYAQVYADKGGFEGYVLTGLRRIRFSYYSFDEQKREYIWKKEWASGFLPLAVRVEVELDRESDEKFVSTISLPVAREMNEKKG
ncbi:hypothetical protein ACFL0T_02720 [Candidatus Omnitrophota bacterium]